MIIMWNTDGIGSRERELREMIAKYEPDIIELLELKTVKADSITRCWSGESVETVPSLRRDIRSAPRAVVADVLRADLVYYVRHVTNEVESRKNGVTQAITIERTSWKGE